MKNGKGIRRINKGRREGGWRRGRGGLAGREISKEDTAIKT